MVARSLASLSCRRARIVPRSVRSRWAPAWGACRLVRCRSISTSTLKARFDHVNTTSAGHSVPSGATFVHTMVGDDLIVLLTLASYGHSVSSHVGCDMPTHTLANADDVPESALIQGF